MLQTQEAPWRIAGEVLNTYIICEDEQENVWLIDKHAAHERVRFNRLKENTEPVMRQTLLTPAAVSLTAEEYTAVLEHLDILAQYGFAARTSVTGRCSCARCRPISMSVTSPRRCRSWRRI